MLLPTVNQEVLLVLLILEMSVAVEKAENYIDVLILTKSILVILKEIGNHNDDHCVMMVMVINVMVIVMNVMVINVILMVIVIW